MSEATTKKTTKTVKETNTEVNGENEKVKEEKKPIIPKDVDLNMYITVRNGFQGQLIYISKKTGEEFYWDAFGDEQEMELAELKNAKNSAKGFFINNWFMFDDENAWVIDYLGLGQFYRNTVSINSFDDLFSMTPAKLKAALNSMPDGQKPSVVYRAYQLVNSGEIDSLKTIAVLEQCLGVELIEK